MSKRFGRNQKRKFRARERQLEDQVRSLNFLLEANRARADKLGKAVNDIITMFSEYSAFSPLRVVNVGGIPLRQKIASCGQLDQKLIDLKTIRSYITHTATEYMYDVHVVMSDGSSFVYGFSGKIFDKFLPATAKRGLCDQFARQIVDFVERKWPSKNATRQNGF